MKIKQKSFKEWYKSFALLRRCTRCRDIVILETMSCNVAEDKSIVRMCNECRDTSLVK